MRAMGEILLSDKKYTYFRRYHIRHFLAPGVCYGMDLLAVLGGHGYLTDVVAITGYVRF